MRVQNLQVKAGEHVTLVLRARPTDLVRVGTRPPKTDCHNFGQSSECSERCLPELRVDNFQQELRVEDEAWGGPRSVAWPALVSNLNLLRFPNLELPLGVLLTVQRALAASRRLLGPAPSRYADRC